MTRDDLIRKISATKAEIQAAGPIHRRDLRKHLRRMERELADYDRFHAQAQKTHISA